MRSSWDGWGLIERNTVTTDVFEAWNCRVTLPDIAGVTMQVDLPTNTHAVLLWTSTEQVWYAIDDDPDPIVAPAVGTAIPATAFGKGDVLMPAGAGGQWQQTALSDPSQAHSLHLRSASVAPTVYVVALREMGL